jgi:hypothetical protein
MEGTSPTSASMTAELRAEMTRLRRHVTTIHTGLAVALVGVLGASQF